MPSLRSHLLAVSAVLLVSVHTGALAQVGVVGILEGKATLVRQVAKFALAEGVSLQNEDIVETAPGSYLQIEFADGGRIGVGGQSRMILAPRAARGAGPRLYLLQGWVKLTQPDDKPAQAASVTPQIELAAVAGATIFSSNAKESAVFVESGSVTLGQRSNERPPLPLVGGSFVLARAGDKPIQAARPTPEFLEQMPRPFRDPLPSRAGKYRDNPVAPKPLGEVSYDDIAPWLVAEPGLRLPLVERWKPRLRDKTFRASMIANLATHPEWDPWVYPEKAAKKRADEKRAREARAAAAAAVAASVQGAASAPRAPD